MDVSTQIFLKTNLDDITLEQISELQRVISHHRRLYNEESPVISDKEYDDLYRLLVQAEEKYGITDTTSPTQSVDHLVSSQFQKVRHAHQMASLDNTYNADDLRDFQTRIHNILKKNTQS